MRLLGPLLSLALLASSLVGQAQKLPVHVENYLGCPGYPRAKGDGNVHSFITNKTPQTALQATTADRPAKIKAFYKKHLRNIRVAYDGNDRFLPSHPSSRKLDMTGIGRYGHHVRITCEPAGK